LAHFWVCNFGIFELQQRAHFLSRFIGTAGLASESKNGTLPYSRCEALPSGRTFPAACCRELQFSWLNRKNSGGALRSRFGGTIYNTTHIQKPSPKLHNVVRKVIFSIINDFGVNGTYF
jgi:hypothetical protein